jgi:diguanylate cyclase (GGDEF)-like protein/PAS domain S-box-containing protein
MTLFPLPDLASGDSSESMMRLVADSVPALIAYYEFDSLKCRFANRRYAEYNGWTAYSILGKTVREVVGEPAWEKIVGYVDQAKQGRGSTYTREQTLPDGSQRIIEVNLLPHFDDAPALQGCFVLINDITDHWKIENELRLSEERMRKFVAATDEGILFHKDLVISDVNEALLRFAGYRRAEVIGRRTFEFIPAKWHQSLLDHFVTGGESPYEAALIHKDGRESPIECVAKTMQFDGETTRLVVVRDITIRKAAQARIEFMALHDMLTDLPNRAFLMERLTGILAMMRRQQGVMALLFIDLDKFKTVNDSMGHQAGDNLLREVARRITASVRDSDVVSRLGGDEFVVLLPDIASSEDSARVAAKLIEAVSAPVTLGGRTISVSPSIGISVFPTDGDSADDLIRHADAAMYHAKESGRGNYQFFAPVMFERAAYAIDMERQLREALTHGEFVLHYQPQRRRIDGAIVGLEALVRWQHPTRGLVGPNEFIGFAETHGLIGRLDRWVLQTACRQLKAWHDEGCARVTVAVNLSALDFRQPGLVQEISAVLQAANLAPHYLEIELTESVLIDRDSQVLEKLTALSRMGIGLTIDDFGTGYSSLAYLKRFPVNKLKIDRSFISDVTSDGDDLAITTAIIQMARSLKLETVAEGVETQSQLDTLRGLGCDNFQGYLISRPLDAQNVRAFIAP